MGDMELPTYEEYLSQNLTPADPPTDEPDCPICREPWHSAEFPHDETVSTPCKHIFHKDCLLTWFSGANTCPTCRRALHSGKEYRNESDEDEDEDDDNDDDDDASDLDLHDDETSPLNMEVLSNEVHQFRDDFQRRFDQAVGATMHAAVGAAYQPHQPSDASEILTAEQADALPWSDYLDYLMLEVLPLLQQNTTRLFEEMSAQPVHDSMVDHLLEQPLHDSTLRIILIDSFIRDFYMTMPTRWINICLAERERHYALLGTAMPVQISMLQSLRNCGIHITRALPSAQPPVYTHHTWHGGSLGDARVEVSEQVEVSAEISRSPSMPQTRMRVWEDRGEWPVYIDYVGQDTRVRLCRMTESVDRDNAEIEYEYSDGQKHTWSFEWDADSVGWAD